MQLSDPNKEQGIIQDVRFLTETDSSSYATSDIVRNANRWGYKAVTWIFEASKGYQWDDPNHTDRAVPTFNLVDGQDWYALPTDMLKLDQVHIKDTNGEWYKLKHIDQAEQDVALDEVYDTKGKPIYYDHYGEEIRMFPAPDSNDVTISNGGRLFLRRDMNLFTATNTAQQPAFTEPFHRIPALGAAYDWLIVHGPSDRASNIRSEIEQLKQEIYDYYADYNRDVKLSIKPNNSRRSTRRQWQ